MNIFLFFFFEREFEMSNNHGDKIDRVITG